MGWAGGDALLHPSFLSVGFKGRVGVLLAEVSGGSHCPSSQDSCVC